MLGIIVWNIYPFLHINVPGGSRKRRLENTNKVVIEACRRIFPKLNLLNTYPSISIVDLKIQSK